jgi:hypothetical protein
MPWLRVEADRHGQGDRESPAPALRRTAEAVAELEDALALTKRTECRQLIYQALSNRARGGR